MRPLVFWARGRFYSSSAVASASAIIAACLAAFAVSFSAAVRPFLAGFTRCSGFPGSRQLCWCGGRSWRSAPHMLLPVRRMGFPDVPAGPRRALALPRKRLLLLVLGPLSWCGAWNARGRNHFSGARVVLCLVPPPICVGGRHPLESTARLPRCLVDVGLLYRRPSLLVYLAHVDEG